MVSEAGTSPHASAPRRGVAGVLKFVVVLADHIVGGHTRWRAARRSGVLIVERGWLDAVVDPRRYRFSRTASRLWARTAPLQFNPDAVVLLYGDASAMDARKPEIGVDEIARQLEEWKRLAPRLTSNVTTCDTVQDPLAVVTHSALRGVLRSTGETLWRAHPLVHPRANLRVSGQRPAVALVYSPKTARARLCAQIGNSIPHVLWRTTPSPLPELADILERLEAAPSSMAAIDSSAPGRLIFSVTTRDRGELVLKVGAANDQGLRNEARFLCRPLRAGLPFRRPDLIDAFEYSDRYVVAMAAEGSIRRPPTNPAALLDLFRSLGNATCEGAPLVHGDLTPWNLLTTARGLVLLDWESARVDSQPLWDLCHFVVMSGSLLGKHTPVEAVSLLTETASPGRRLLAESAPRSAPRSVFDHLEAYLESAIAAREARTRRFAAEMRRLIAS
jgi:hypothetical protein